MCYDVTAPSFDLYWHFHPEYELTYIVTGTGKRLVGSSYETFAQGDFVLLGPNVPHTWISDKKKKQNCRAIVIQFTNAFADNLSLFEEFKEINKMLLKADKGVRFLKLKNNFMFDMIEILQLPHTLKLLKFMQLLQTLSSLKTQTLNNHHFKPIKQSNQFRINKVFQYVQNTYKQQVSLQKAASLIHLTDSAFCKYFKRISGKTFSDYVNDIRIAHACELLIETDKTIAQIANESGYETLTYFNRIFLKKKSMKPNTYRNLS